MKHKNTELAFLAGLFMARGNIKIEKPKYSTDYALYVWITARDFRLMELLQTFGARVDKREDGQYRAKWKNVYAGKLLDAISPYLLTNKKDQAEVGIEFTHSIEQHLDKNDYEVPLRLRLKLLKREEEED